MGDCVKERGILFSDEMVRAILDGRKTQTRRPLIPQPRLYPSHHAWACVKDPLHVDAFVGTAAEGSGRGGERQDVWWSEDWCGNLIGEYGSCPFGSPGDRIYVREAFAIVPSSAYRCSTGIEQTINPADRDWAAVYRVGFDRSRHFPWKPSIHMPRWASRITLEVKAVRVERVQEIDERDAASEGFENIDGFDGHPLASPEIELFRRAWNSIYAPNVLGWDKNPWVWVVEFERVAR